MLKREDIIALVAKEHGILISRDDPILALLAVHQVLVDHYVRQLRKNFEGMNQQLCEQLSDIQSRYSEQSRQLANDMPVGATTTVFLWLFLMILCSNVVFPVPAFPVRKIFCCV